MISSNIYNAVKGPSNRGFSFIEIYYFGTQSTILVGTIEYGILLATKKYGHKLKNAIQSLDYWLSQQSEKEKKKIEEKDENLAKKIDMWAFVGRDKCFFLDSKLFLKNVSFFSIYVVLEIF